MDRRKVERRWQCTSVCHTGRASYVFCQKQEGHKDDHRGYRAQWNKKGERVPITEKAL